MTSLLCSHQEVCQETYAGKVYIVDDDAGSRRALVMLAQSVGLPTEAFPSAEEFLAQYDRQRGGCLVLDVRMPGMSGIELQKAHAASGGLPPIIFVTGHGEIPLAAQAIRDGAIDFIPKPISPETLIERIHEALAIDRQRREKQARAARIKERLQFLTQREHEIMRLLADGETAKHIASQLSISPKTVDNHRAKILEKMDVENPTQLAHLLADLE